MSSAAPPWLRRICTWCQWQAVERPNLMIKVPATRAGLPVITALIADGINVNVTLIFGIERHRAVMDAYLAGLDHVLAAHRPIDRIASVASFFVSRIDTLVDAQLEAKIGAADGNDSDMLRSLLGKTAIANAKLAYDSFASVFYGERFAAYRDSGAQVQRPLWASTSTKNPKYRDVGYVEALIGKDTVDTMPLATLHAFADHGTVRETITAQIDVSRNVLQQLARVGIDLDVVTQHLEAEGIATFAASFDTLLASIEAKRQALEGEAGTT
jgi:transaldolase/glucose-6-phosphate isomerase